MHPIAEWLRAAAEEASATPPPHQEQRGRPGSARELANFEANLARVRPLLARAHAMPAMFVWTACAAVSSTTVPSLAIDPLITRLLRANGAAAFPPSLDEINAAAEGLTVWRHALAAGRLPDYGGADGGLPPWPPQPLLGTLTDTLSRLSLPRATARHPSLVPPGSPRRRARRRV